MRARADQRRRRLARALARHLPLAIAWLAVAVPSVATFWARESWHLDVLVNFRVQFALAATLGVGLALLARRRVWMGLFAAVLALNLLEILRPPDTVEPAAGERVHTIIAYNVYSRNERMEDVLAWLRDQEPDAFFLLEYERWMREPLAVLEQPREEGGGGYTRSFRLNRSICLYSRLPFTERLSTHGLTAFEIELPGRDESLLLAGIHLESPRDPRSWAGRNRQLRELVRVLGRFEDPLVMLGDMNCSPYSPYYNDFVEDSGLAPVRAGWLAPITWHGQWPLVFTSIDQAFTSPSVHTVDKTTGPRIGSDHHPIIHRFVVRGP
jgi:endonuclease/exonuclease/phosphatase (EEP) superfamily protein YafD